MLGLDLIKSCLLVNQVKLKQHSKTIAKSLCAYIRHKNDLNVSLKLIDRLYVNCDFHFLNSNALSLTLIYYAICHPHINLHFLHVHRSRVSCDLKDIKI